MVIICFKNLLISKRKYNFNKIFISRYPLHFSKNGKELKYGKLFKSDDGYIICVLSDGFHQNISFIKLIKSTFSHVIRKSNFVNYDNYHNFTSLFISLRYWLNIRKSFFSLTKKIYIFKDINITILINNELLYSYFHVIRIIINEKAFNQCLKDINFNKCIYHLHEYCLGRMYTYRLKKNFSETIGFQHGPATENKLLYFIEADNNYTYNDFLYNCPRPDQVYSEDFTSKRIYEKNNYKDVLLLDSVPRYEYLIDFKRILNPKYILIVPGLHDINIMLASLSEDIKNKKSENFILKPHPRSRKKVNLRMYPNLGISNEPIINLLKNTKLVYVTYSSVYYECKLLNIPVQRIHLHGLISQ